MKARRNPFRSDRVEAFRYRLTEQQWEVLRRRFEDLGRRAAIVGPHGTGKTVLTEDFRARLEADGVPTTILRFHDRFSRRDRLVLRDRLSALPPRTVIILDGGELLPRRIWRRLSASLDSGNGILTTLHHPRQLPVLFETRPQLEIARELIRSMLGRPLHPEECASVDERFTRAGGNIRDVVRSFYLEYAGLPVPHSLRHAEC